MLLILTHTSHGGYPRNKILWRICPGQGEQAAVPDDGAGLAGCCGSWVWQPTYG